MTGEIIGRQEGLEWLIDEIRDDLSEFKTETESYIEKRKIKEISQEKYDKLCLRKTLTDKETQQVVKFANEHDLHLNLWLTNITDNQAKILSEAFRLELNWLTNITLDQLEILSKKEGLLALDWLKSLTEAQALLLSKVERLHLNWLNGITEKAAYLLLIWNVEILELKWLEKMTDAQAKLLSSLGNRLRINEDVLTTTQKKILWR